LGGADAFAGFNILPLYDVMWLSLSNKTKRTDKDDIKYCTIGQTVTHIYTPAELPIHQTMERPARKGVVIIIRLDIPTRPE
jgi:hypothetical protein